MAKNGSPNSKIMIAKLSSISFARWLRMIIGVFFIFSAFGEKRWGIGVLGFVLLLQGVLNKGCGLSQGSCGQTTSSTKHAEFNPNTAFRKLDL